MFSDQIFHSMDNGCLTRAVLLDLVKAFDTVNHSLVLEKLSYLGFDAAARAWFTSFLANRKQVTICNDVCSEAASFSIGVAQCSILGLLLFIIFMNNLLEALQYIHVTLFAVLYFASKSVIRYR